MMSVNTSVVLSTDEPSFWMLLGSAYQLARLPMFGWCDAWMAKRKVVDALNLSLFVPSRLSQFPKVYRTCSDFNILTSERASRHNGVHFFENSMVLFTCRLQNYFAPK